MKNIAGKVALVTGGARGLGKAMVERLLAEGATVVIADILEEEGRKAAAEFKARDLPADYVKVDLRQVSEIDAMVAETAKRHGGLDILVNNAGIQIRKWAVDFEEEEWDLLMGINLKAYYFAARAAARIMIPKRQGSIVCISSGNSANYTSKRSLYCIAKTGVNGLVGTLGVEWARYGLRINAVAPGFINTEMLKSGIRDGLVNEPELMSILPNKRLIEPEEVAAAVCFRASDDASGITGQTLFVDGGWNKNGLPEKKDLQ